MRDLSFGSRRPARSPRAARDKEVEMALKEVQATVKEFRETGEGLLLLDDGTELAFPPEAFRESGLARLNFAQRVRILLDEETGRVVSLKHITL